MVASILDPAHKHLPTVPEEVRPAAYNNVRELLSTAALYDDESAEDEEEGEESTANVTVLDFILGEQRLSQPMQSLRATCQTNPPAV